MSQQVRSWVCSLHTFNCGPLSCRISIPFSSRPTKENVWNGILFYAWKKEEEKKWYKMVEHMWFICCSAKREPTIQPPFWPRDLLRPMSPGQCSAQSCFQFCDPPPCETTPWTESLTCYSFHPSPILRSHWFIRRTSQSAPCLMFNKYCTSLKTRASPQRSLKREQNGKAVAKPGWKSRSYSRLSFFSSQSLE